MDLPRDDDDYDLFRRVLNDIEVRVDLPGDDDDLFRRVSSDIAV